MKRMTDVLIVGGGVIGLSTAFDLAGQGVAVTVVEQGAFGGEASWAGAGILPPGNPRGAQSAEARLRAASHILWPEWTAQLRELTGIDNGYFPCGGIEVRRDGPTDQLDDEIAVWRTEGVQVETCRPIELRQREPALHPEIVAGYRLPELAQVRNPRHVKALLAGCAARGVRLIAGQPVVGFERRGERVAAVRTSEGTHAADRFCVAGGAWSRQILSEIGCAIAVQPVRGQIVLLSAVPLPLRHVVQSGSRYLVPRPDGRILIGSTEERVGFDKRNTAGAIRDLLDFGTSVAPALRDAKFERAWAGLRPGSPDGLPYLGRVPGTGNLFVAAGHFRAGLQMSPATGRIMRQLLLGQEPLIPLDGYAVDRGS